MQSSLRIAHLLRHLKQVDGRKKLQKLVHTLQELGYPFDEYFEYSFYGMYSKQLRDELDALVSSKLVTEHENRHSFGSTFSFEATPQLDELLSDLGTATPPEWAATAESLNELSAQELEGISTILFLRRRGFEGAALRDRLIALKPHLRDVVEHCEQKAEQLLQERGCCVTTA